MMSLQAKAAPTLREGAEDSTVLGEGLKKTARAT